MHLNHDGKTYEIGAMPAALDALAFVLPDGAVLGVEWTEGMPPTVKAIHVLSDEALKHAPPGAVVIAAEVHIHETPRVLETKRVDAPRLRWTKSSDKGAHVLQARLGSHVVGVVTQRAPLAMWDATTDGDSKTVTSGRRGRYMAKLWVECQLRRDGWAW